MTSRCGGHQGAGAGGYGCVVGHAADGREEAECGVGHSDGWGSWSPLGAPKD